jgi:predicted HicB family RNase H-like nuclease
MSTSIPTVPLTLRVPPELKERLAAHQRWVGHSLNAVGVALLEEALDRQEVLRAANEKKIERDSSDSR